MVGGNFDIPIMHQDLASYTMNPMMPFGNMIGGNYANTSYLGGTSIKPQLDHDKVQLMNKKSQEGLSTAKKVALALAAVFAIGFIPKLFGKTSFQGHIVNFYKKHSPAAKTFLQNTWNNIKSIPSKIKNLFHKKATP